MRSGEAVGMLRPLLGISEPDLERELLRKGVGAREARRRHCSDCGRTPLVGERMFRFGTSATVCELCTPLRRAEPDAAYPVHHMERGITVRRITPRAA